MGKRTNTAVWYEKQARWQIKVQKNGERRTFTSSKPGRTGQREANAKADAWLDEGIVKTSTKISKIYAEYLAEMESLHPWSLIRPLKSRYNTWIEPAIGRIKIGDLTEQHLQRIINAAYSAGRSRKTIMNIRSDLTAFMKYCRKCKYSTLFPENLTIPKDAAVKEKHILLPEDLRILFSEERTKFKGEEQFEDLIYAFRFHVLTGLRPGELLGLEWSDIDLEKGTVHIRRSFNEYGETTKGKNKSANRIFALSEYAAQVLRDQRQINAFGKVFGDCTQSAYRRRWKRYCAHNGITRTTPYELRHTFISVSAEMPEGMLQPLVGHVESMDSFGTYGHSYDDMRRKTAQKSTEIWAELLEK